MGYESGLEDHTSLMLCIRPDFKDIREQPEPVIFFDQRGKRREHYFDFLFTSTNGVKSAIAVRPLRRATAKYRATLALIAKQFPSPFADQLVLITEDSFCRNRVRDVERYFAFHAFEDFEADEALRSYFQSNLKLTCVETIVSDLAIGSRGLSAIFRAVISGALRKQARYPLGYKSIVLSGGSV